jgi:hypothetical protein
MSSHKRIQRISHPAYNPDLAPSDFFLFDYVMQKLAEYDTPDQQSSERSIAHIFDEIGQKTLTAVFETWTNRLE